MRARVNFQVKQIVLTFSAQICPKMNSGLEIDKTNVGIRINTLEILCANFQPKRPTLTFSAQIYLKIDLGLEIQKTNNSSIFLFWNKS